MSTFKKLRRTAILASSILALTCGVAIAGTTLTFSPLSLGIPALKGLSEGVKHIGADQGYEVIVVDPNFDAPTQAQQLNQLIETGKTQAAWVLAVNPGSMKGVLEAAIAKNVVMLVNGEPKDYGMDGLQQGITFTKIDYAEFGSSIGSVLGECVTKNLAGKAKVIFVQQTEGTVGKESIDAEMQKGLAAAAPGAEIVATIVVKDRVEAQTKIGQVLQAHPDANALMTPNDEAGLGALGAFDAAGKSLACLVDGGGNDEVLKAVADKKMYGAVALNFKADVMQTFGAIAEMLKDPKAQGKQLKVPLDIQKQP